MEKVKYIISDLGGVVLEIDFNRFAKAVKKASLINNDSEFDYRLKRLSDAVFYKLFYLGKISPTDFYANSCSYLRLYISYDDFIKYWNAIIIKPNKNYCAFLKKAEKAGYALILLSNLDIIHWEHSCKICKAVFKLFSRIFLSCDAGFEKPDPLFFASTLYRMRIKSREAVFIDDRLENIQAAKNLGIPSILYDSRQHPKFLNEFKKLCPDFPNS